MGPAKSGFLWYMSMMRNKKEIVYGFNSRNLSSALKWNVVWSVFKKSLLAIFVENKQSNGYSGLTIVYHDFLLL